MEVTCGGYSHRPMLCTFGLVALLGDQRSLSQLAVEQRPGHLRAHLYSNYFIIKFSAWHFMNIHLTHDIQKFAI